MRERWRTRVDTAWILHRRSQGEADLWLEAYAQDLGRIRLLARGGRKVPSRKGGHLQLFQEVRLSLAQGRGWWVVTQAQAQRWFPRLREQLEAFVAAGYVAELVLRLVPLGERLPGLYPLLTSAFTVLAERPWGPRWVPRVVEWQLMALAGYRPTWERCVHCGKPLALGRPKYLDALAGGVACEACRRAGAPALSDRAWALVRHWLRVPLERALAQEPEPELHLELARLGERYVRAWLERPSRAQRVAHQLDVP